MFDEDTNLSEVESAFSSTAIINKILWAKKKKETNTNG